MAPTVQEYREFSLAAQYRNEPCMALVYPDGEVLFIPPVDIKVKTPCVIHVAILVITVVKVFPQVICANFSFTAGPMVRTFKRVNGQYVRTRGTLTSAN